VSLVAGRALAVRLDNAGDVLLAGPALRAMAQGSRRLVALCGPHGADAARLLPGVDEVITWRCPWIDPDPDAVQAEDLASLTSTLSAESFDTAVVYTSFHQSPLPTALLLRMAGIRYVAAISADYPGALLDVRHHVDEDIPEPERAVSLAMAAGFRLPDGDDGGLQVRRPLVPLPTGVPPESYVVLHPGTSVPARAWPPQLWAETAQRFGELGLPVVVTGGPGDGALTSFVCSGARGAVDLGGRTSFAQLAAVLAEARAVVVGNTGPAHLAAAVGTPVVSLFAPTVPAVRWAPYRVPMVLLGDQQAPCQNSRARVCPVPGHPCLSSVTPSDVLRAVSALTPRAGDVEPALHEEAV
jgi:ADP-heptose:LPS heptosyltransferase